MRILQHISFWHPRSIGPWNQDVRSYVYVAFRAPIDHPSFHLRLFGPSLQDPAGGPVSVEGRLTPLSFRSLTYLDFQSTQSNAFIP